MEEVVDQLLDGENFHFGNPFLDWLVTRDWTFWIPAMKSVTLNVSFCFRGTSVCSGRTHPDQIVSQEECLRAAKRRYYADLEKYHNEYVQFSLFRLYEHL